MKKECFEEYGLKGHKIEFIETGRFSEPLPAKWGFQKHFDKIGFKHDVAKILFVCMPEGEE